MAMTILRRVLLALLLLLTAAAVATYVYFRRVLPQTDGELALPGLHASLKIERDGQGIPTIRGADLHDLMFGLGVAHVQDRLWQMETHRRIGAGRVAEAFGEGAVDTDRVLRTLGVRKVAAAQWAQTRGEAREVLLAYTEGVNAALHQLVKARPPEFVILGLQPEDWDPVDSLAWSIMMAWDLGGNWNNELLRLRLGLRLPLERVQQLMPPPAGEKPLPTIDYPAFYKSLKIDSAQAALDHAADRLMAAAPPSGIEGEGSNNWVLSGSRTTTGAPLLANDPHLKLSAPALWYFARLVMPGWQAAGATLPGVPGVILGQNEDIAWGFTNTGPDVQDLYLERVKPDDPTQYQTPEGWAKFESAIETIRVRGKPDVTITVRRGRHGPVISDAGMTDEIAIAKAGLVLTMRWTGLDVDVDPVGTGLRMSRAKSVDEFIAATRGWAAPMQNMVVADRAGHIGLIAPGRVPLRRADNDLMGVAPAPGWDARYDWQGWLPFDALPQQRDPESGYIATANQRIVPPDYPHHLTQDWALPYRHQRIVQMIERRAKHSQDDLRAMHADQRSLAVARLLPRLLRASSDHALAPAAKRALAAFTGTMKEDSPAPLIYWSWLRHLSQRVLADELGAALYDRTLGSRGYFDAIDNVMAADDPWWCDDKATPAVETCEQQVQAALGDALDELRKLQGDDVAAWRWGRAHLARAEHRPFSRVPALARWFELRAPVGGDTYTVNVSQVSLRPDATTGEYYLDNHGPSLRAIYDLADRSKSGVMHSTGQSGIPWSPRYRDFLPQWAAVQYLPLWTQAAPAATLTLLPAR
jgi:penicillin G amidase